MSATVRKKVRSGGSGSSRKPAPETNDGNDGAERKVAPLLNSVFSDAEYERMIWGAYPAPGVQPDDLLKPSYWANVGAQMQPYHKIEVRPEDGSYYGELLVLSCGPGFAQVQTLFIIELGDQYHEKVTIGPYLINYGGPVQKWRVIRASDNHVMSQGFSNKGQALRWATDNQNIAA